MQLRSFQALDEKLGFNLDRRFYAIGLIDETEDSITLETAINNVI